MADVAADPDAAPVQRTSARLSGAAKEVLAKVHIEAAFGTLRKLQSCTAGLAWSDLQFTRELGKGSFGLVGLYKWRPGAMKRLEDGTLVPREGTLAVKSLLPAASASATAVSDFVTEVAILERLSHSCIVGCLGTGTHPDPKTGHDLLFVAMEAVTGGDLRSKVLEAMMAPHLYTNADAVRWLHDISRGLHYLHTRSPKIIHRDLKLENVLLDARWNAKITDFGLIKAIVLPKASEAPAPSSDDTYVMTGGTGSLKYMAPEIARGLPSSEKLDCYSFSIIAWELFARTMLLFQRTKKVGHAKCEYTPRLWVQDAAAGVRPEQPVQWPEDVRKLMAACWAHDPSARPAMAEVMHALEPLLQPHLQTDPTKAKAAAGDPSAGCCTLQ